jgi:hypothetical protein
MSLLRFLSAAKSLDGSKPMPSPYKVTAGLLPKFGSPKNPFARPTKPEAKSGSGPMETESLFGDEPKKTPVTPKAPVVREAKPVVAPEKKIEAKPTTAVTAAPTAPVVKQAKPSALAGLIKKLNPLAHLPKRQPGARAAASFHSKKCG